MKKLLIPLLCILCISCTTVEPKYVEPNSGPTASIYFENKSMKSLKIAYYEVSHLCQKRRHTDAILPGTTSVHKVQANKEITFQFYLTNFATAKQEESCLLNIRFEPKVNGNYKIIAAEDAFRCLWLAVDNTDPDKPVQLEPIPWKAGWGEEGSFCSK